MSISARAFLSGIMATGNHHLPECGVDANAVAALLRHDEKAYPDPRQRDCMGWPKYDCSVAAQDTMTRDELVARSRCVHGADKGRLVGSMHGFHIPRRERDRFGGWGFGLYLGEPDKWMLWSQYVRDVIRPAAAECGELVVHLDTCYAGGALRRPRRTMLREATARATNTGMACIDENGIVRKTLLGPDALVVESDDVKADADDDPHECEVPDNVTLILSCGAHQTSYGAFRGYVYPVVTMGRSLGIHCFITTCEWLSAWAEGYDKERLKPLENLVDQRTTNQINSLGTPAWRASKPVTTYMNMIVRRGKRASREML